MKFWWTAAAVFALIALINYFPIFTGQVPFPRDQVVRHAAWNGQPQEHLPELIDIVAMFYPFRAFLGRAGAERTVPLWNPHIMSGAPFQANAQSAVFAPLNVLYYVLPLKAAWAIILVIRVFLAGVFMTLFVRSIGAAPAGAILSGILFALCGFTVQWQGMSNGDSCIWLPLMCYAVHRLYRNPNRRSIALAAAVFPMPLLSGHPETAAHSTMVACGFAAFLYARNPLPSREGVAPAARRLRAEFAAGFIFAGVLAIGIASVQLLPSLEWLGQLGLRVDAPEPVLDRHQGQGFFSRDITKNPSSAGVWIPEGSAYVGMAGLLAASLSIFYRPRRYVVFLVGIAVVAVLVAFGVQPIRWIVVHLPIIKAMKNGRLTLVADFALAALAGLGISSIPRDRVRAMAWLGAAFLVLSFGIFEVHRATLTPVEFSRGPLASLIFLVAAFIAVAFRNPAVICVLASIEMLTFSYGYLRFAPAPEVFPPAPLLEFIRTRETAAPFRVAKDRVPLPHDAGMIYGFEAADGYDLTTERTRTFTADLIEDRDDGVMFLAEKILAVSDRRFDMLNVKYLIVSRPGPQFELLSASNRFTPAFSEGLTAVFENERVLPRFFGVPLSGIEILSEPTAQLARIKQTAFDPQRSVVVAEPLSGGETVGQGALEFRADVLERGINGYKVRLESNQPAVLVVSQMYYPGWRAAIDGSAAAVLPVDVALTGLVVPNGTHELRLYFQPASFQIGVLISLAALATTFLVAGVRKRAS
jgi:hypothetical protein